MTSITQMENANLNLCPPYVSVVTTWAVRGAANMSKTVEMSVVFVRAIAAKVTRTIEIMRRYQTSGWA